MIFDIYKGGHGSVLQCHGVAFPIFLFLFISKDNIIFNPCVVLAKIVSKLNPYMIIYEYGYLCSFFMFSYTLPPSPPPL